VNPATLCVTLLSMMAGPNTSPVPKDAKPPVSCAVALDAKLGPLDMKAWSVTLTNNNTEAVGLYSTLPGGLLVFLDVEIEGPDGKRISPKNYDAMIASPFAPPPRLVGSLEPNKPVKLELWLARYVEKPEELVPGKYRVRVKFGYAEDKSTTSEWTAFEVKKADK
jgi:hypothetical protein